MSRLTSYGQTLITGRITGAAVPRAATAVVTTVSLTMPPPPTEPSAHSSIAARANRASSSVRMCLVFPLPGSGAHLRLGLPHQCFAETHPCIRKRLPVGSIDMTLEEISVRSRPAAISSRDGGALWFAVKNAGNVRSWLWYGTPASRDTARPLLGDT